MQVRVGDVVVSSDDEEAELDIAEMFAKVFDRNWPNWSAKGPVSEVSVRDKTNGAQYLVKHMPHRH